MVYLVPIVVIVFGLTANLLVEVSAELSSQMLLEGDAGVTSQGIRMVGGKIVDMRPEASLPLP